DIKRSGLCWSSRRSGAFSGGVPMFDDFSVHDAEHVKPRRGVGFILESGIDVLFQDSWKASGRDTHGSISKRLVPCARRIPSSASELGSSGEKFITAV